MSANRNVSVRTESMKESLERDHFCEYRLFDSGASAADLALIASRDPPPERPIDRSSGDCSIVAEGTGDRDVYAPRLNSIRSRIVAAFCR